MDKLKLAHDWAMKHGSAMTHKTVIDAWAYADAMQAEAEKRVSKERPEALCEVDWRIAPCWAKEWVMRDGAAKWECGTSSNSWEEAPSFGFTGSHVVERPNGF